MTKTATQHITPPGCLRREDAARYSGCSPSHFDKMVHEGVFPKSRNLRGVKVWLRAELDDVQHALPVIGGEVENTCDALFSQL